MAETKLLSPSRVKEITERVEKATAGPWEVDKFNDDIVWGPEHAHIADARGYGGHLPFKENAALMAASRTDIPDLLTERELLVGTVRKLAEVGHHRPDCNWWNEHPFGGGATLDTEFGCDCGLDKLLSDPNLVELLKKGKGE